SYTTVSPLPGTEVPGGLLSVALSRGSPRVAVSHHPALWSPDVPRGAPARGTPRGRPPGSSAVLTMVRDVQRAPGRTFFPRPRRKSELCTLVARQAGRAEGSGHDQRTPFEAPRSHDRVCLTLPRRQRFY